MVRTEDQYNGRAVLSRWNAGPRVTDTRYKVYLKTSSGSYSQNLARCYTSP